MSSKQEFPEFNTGTPESILQVTGRLRQMGARAHEGYEVDQEVSNFKDKFAAGVTRVDKKNNVVASPEHNSGGYPAINNGKGRLVLVSRALHTHARTPYRSHSVPVRIEGFSPKQMDEYDEMMDDEIGLG
jgi:hypothetical protein